MNPTFDTTEDEALAVTGDPPEAHGCGCSLDIGRPKPEWANEVHA